MPVKKTNDEEIKTIDVLECCDAPAITKLHPTRPPWNLTGTCDACGARWLFHHCYLDEDGLVVAQGYSRI